MGQSTSEVLAAGADNSTNLQHILIVMKDMMDDLGLIHFFGYQLWSQTNSTAVHLRVYVERMETFEGIAAESVKTNRQRAMVVLERKCLDQGSMRLDPKNFLVVRIQTVLMSSLTGATLQ